MTPEVRMNSCMRAVIDEADRVMLDMVALTATCAWGIALAEAGREARRILAGASLSLCLVFPLASMLPQALAAGLSQSQIPAWSFVWTMPIGVAVAVWYLELQSGRREQLPATPRNCAFVTFSHDGKAVATAGGDTLRQVLGEGPVLVLLDEVLIYVEKAMAVERGESLDSLLNRVFGSAEFGGKRRKGRRR